MTLRCHYLSDLHLESQEFPWRLPKGEVLIIAGDLCHAACLGPARQDLYAARQRDRVLRFADEAVGNFAHVLLIAGNHDHYDGVFSETVASLRSALPGFTVLDDSGVEIAGVNFFGTTLWSNFEGGNPESLERARRGCGEFFFVKVHEGEKIRKFQPADAADAHDRAVAAMKRFLQASDAKSAVVISHHAPSLKGLNPVHSGNGLDGAYASDLDALIERLPNVPVWVHGHTHIKKQYRIGSTLMLANCRGFERQGGAVRGFTVNATFDV